MCYVPVINNCWCLVLVIASIKNGLHNGKFLGFGGHHQVTRRGEASIILLVLKASGDSMGPHDESIGCKRRIDEVSTFGETGGRQIHDPWELTRRSL